MVFTVLVVFCSLLSTDVDWKLSPAFSKWSEEKLKNSFNVQTYYNILNLNWNFLFLYCNQNFKKLPDRRVIRYLKIPMIFIIVIIYLATMIVCAKQFSLLEWTAAGYLHTGEIGDATVLTRPASSSGVKHPLSPRFQQYLLLFKAKNSHVWYNYNKINKILCTISK